MKRYKLVNDNGYVGFQEGQIYNENFVVYGWSTLEVVETYPEDWELVSDDGEVIKDDRSVVDKLIEIYNNLSDEDRDLFNRITRGI